MLALQALACAPPATADNDGPRRAEAQAGTIAVVYPDLGEPYRTVFAQMLEGIEAGTRLPVRSFPVAGNADAGDLSAQLRRNGARAVIALGRQGLKAAMAVDKDLPLVVGGVLTMPEGESRAAAAISLTPDPALLFARLKNLQPGVRRVMVVYSPQNDWLIRLAREAARAQGLELATFEARDLAAAVRLYDAAFAGSDGRRDALWLPQDAVTVDESTVLPLVLKESWNRNVPVFSSSFLHVKKGALFALYPNNVELGRSLAAAAMTAMLGEPQRHGLLPLRDVHAAINVRTASHIGLMLNYQQQRTYDAIFPEP